MITARVAAEALASFCKDDKVGIGISLDIFNALLNQQLRHVDAYAKKLISTYAFKSLSVVFSPGVDVAKVKTSLRNVSSTGGGGAHAGLSLDGFAVNLEVALDGKHVYSCRLEWTILLGRLAVEDGAVVVVVQDQKYEHKGIDRIWERDASLKSHFESTHGFTDDAWKDLRSHLDGAVIASAPTISSSVLRSIETPNLFSVFSGIIFEKQFDLALNNDLLLLAAPGKLDFTQCATARARGTTQVSVTATVDGKPADIDNPKASIRAHVADNSASRQYPEVGARAKETGPSGTGDLFLRLPLPLLTLNFDGAIKPAAQFGEKPRVLIFYVRYSGTLSPKKDIKIELTSERPLEFTIYAPTKVEGQVAAGINLACLSYEPAGVMYAGTIEPLEVVMQLTLCTDRMELTFVSRLGPTLCNDMAFQSSPRPPFPLDLIANLVIALILKLVVQSKADTVLSTTRIPLGNLRLLEGLGKIRPELATSKDSHRGATIGVKVDYVK